VKTGIYYWHCANAMQASQASISAIPAIGESEGRGIFDIYIARKEISLHRRSQ
jgi:hypothetical protein